MFILRFLLWNSLLVWYYANGIKCLFCYPPEKADDFEAILTFYQKFMNRTNGSNITTTMSTPKDTKTISTTTTTTTMVTLKSNSSDNSKNLTKRDSKDIALELVRMKRKGAGIVDESFYEDDDYYYSHFSDFLKPLPIPPNCQDEPIVVNCDDYCIGCETCTCYFDTGLWSTPIRTCGFSYMRAACLHAGDDKCLVCSEDVCNSMKFSESQGLSSSSHIVPSIVVLITLLAISIFLHL